MLAMTRMIALSLIAGATGLAACGSVISPMAGGSDGGVDSIQTWSQNQAALIAAVKCDSML